MSVALSERIKAVQSSRTLAVSQRARELRAAGRPVIGLGAGEPDFDTPEHVREAAVAAIAAGHTRYTAVDGIPELKVAIAAKLEHDNGLYYASNEIMVSVGAKQCLFNLALSLLNPGDEVIVPAPYWVSYPEMARLAGAVPRVVPTTLASGFRMTPEALEEAITPATRLLILNSPGNPTGGTYSRADFVAFGQVLERYPRVLIASDEIYEHIYWADEPYTSFGSACPQLHERTVLINGVSKCYAMTGWRIGYAAGPADLIAAMRKLQGQSTSNPASVSQYAALAALTGPQDCVKEMCHAFRERHDFVVPALNAIPGVRCATGGGTFYALPDVSGVIERMPGIEDDVALAEHLLQEAEVALVPGIAFGAPGHLRLSFATDMQTLHTAIARLESRIVADLAAV